MERKPPGVGDGRPNYLRPIDGVPGFEDAMGGPRDALTTAMIERLDQEHEARMSELMKEADEREHREFVDKLAMMLWCQWDPIGRTYDPNTKPEAMQAHLDDRARKCVAEAERLWRVRHG